MDRGGKPALPTRGAASEKATLGTIRVSAPNMEVNATAKRAKVIPAADHGEARSAAHKHFSSLDGLRAIALSSVMIHHYAPMLFHGGSRLRDGLKLILDLGGLGVDLFFALSGFLITGILYDSIGRRDFFRRFYWRRSLRIFPAYALFLLPFLFIPSMFQHLGRWWFVLYLRNWAGPDPASDNWLGHLWSLAVEEQFYIFWALAVYFCPKRHLAKLIILLCVFALVFRGAMIVSGFSRYDQIRFTPARIDGLLMGGLVAIAWRRYPWAKVQRAAFYCAVLSALSFTGILVAVGTLDNHFAELVLPSLSAIFFASCVAVSLTRKSMLQSPALAHIAKYSYAMYLWHLLPYMFGQLILASLRGPSPAGMLLAKSLFIPVLFLVTYLLARISWATVEEPFLRLKDRF